MDAGRDVDLERPLLERAARHRCTSRTDARSLRPVPWHSRAGRRADELAEEAARDLLQPAGAAAARAGRDVRARAAAPSPLQVVHVTATSSLTSAVVAARGLDEIDLDLGRRRPRRARAAGPRLPNRSSPKNAEKRSPRLPKSKWVGVKPPRAKTGVAVAVVELRASRRSRAPRRPRTTSRKRTSASGSLETSGMQLPRERAERLLDLALVRVAGDAEQLVVVAFGGRHGAHRASGGGVRGCVAGAPTLLGS